MTDATLSQTNRLLELIGRESQPKDFLQALLENWGSVQQIGRGKLSQAQLKQLAAMEVNPYAVERIAPYRYYPRRWRPKSVKRQLDILRDFYPTLDSSKVMEIAARMHVPSTADGLFVVPKLSVVAGDLISDPFTTHYGVMVEMVLQKVAEKRAFTKRQTGNLVYDHMRLRDTTLKALQKFEEWTEGDYIVLPVQTGKKYAGHTLRNARWEIEHSVSEFCLEAWVGAHILLTHPERLVNDTNLIMDMPGTDYQFNSGDKLGVNLYFSFSNGELEFGFSWLVYGYFGSASGFSR